MFKVTLKLFTNFKIGLSVTFLENLQIEWKKPELNCDIKATK